MFYNTNGLHGEALSSVIQNNATQKEVIKELFKSRPQTVLTAYDVLESLAARGVFYKETSIRRAMTDLKNEGYLQETTISVEKYSGHPNKALKWRL